MITHLSSPRISRLEIVRGAPEPCGASGDRSSSSDFFTVLTRQVLSNRFIRARAMVNSRDCELKRFQIQAAALHVREAVRWSISYRFDLGHRALADFRAARRMPRERRRPAAQRTGRSSASARSDAPQNFSLTIFSSHACSRSGPVGRRPIRLLPRSLTMDSFKVFQLSRLVSQCRSLRCPLKPRLCGR